MHHVLVVALDAIGVTDAAAKLDADPDVSFAALDVDSLGVIEVVARLETECDITIPDDVIDRLERPADILTQARLVQIGET